jgi:hypothetical protein
VKRERQRERESKREKSLGLVMPLVFQSSVLTEVVVIMDGFLCMRDAHQYIIMCVSRRAYGHLCLSSPFVVIVEVKAGPII